MATVILPAGLDAQRELGLDWGRWLDRLPRLLADLLDEWHLTPEGDELWHGFCSLVAPVTREQGVRAVLKITFDGDSESLHEGLVLQHWHGDGAVRMLRADPHRRALLLERLERRDLSALRDHAACEVVADLYGRLDRPAPPQLSPVTAHVARGLDDLTAQPRDTPVPSRYRAQALSLGRQLVADPASTGRIIHGDLHYGNVLAAPSGLDPARGPWLAIDPKPMSGDRHYEVAPMLWNRFDELAGDVRNGVRRRFRTLVDRAGLDEDRARAWTVVRVVLNANATVQDAQRARRDLTAEQRDWITRCIALTKAVQD